MYYCTVSHERLYLIFEAAKKGQPIVASQQELRAAMPIARLYAQVCNEAGVWVKVVNYMVGLIKR